MLDEKDSIPILKAAWDRGINTIDTSNNYSNGESEKIIAKFIEQVVPQFYLIVLHEVDCIVTTQYNIPRHEIVIATKCFNVIPHDVSVRGNFKPELKKQREYINQYGLSRAGIFNAVDASLRRLNTSYIDLLQIHRFDPDTPAEETMKALHDLVQSGKVRYIGASSMRAWQFAHLNEVASRHGWTKFVSMQNQYSLLYREEVRPFTYTVIRIYDDSKFVSTGTRDAGLLQVQWHRRHSLGSHSRRSTGAPSRSQHHAHRELERNAYGSYVHRCGQDYHFSGGGSRWQEGMDDGPSRLGLGGWEDYQPNRWHIFSEEAGREYRHRVRVNRGGEQVP